RDRAAAIRDSLPTRRSSDLGLAQFALRQYGDAADTFMDALETDPTSPDAFLAWNALPTFVIVAAWEKIQPRLRHLAGRFPENPQDRKSTRLNSSHGSISYAV